MIANIGYIIKQQRGFTQVESPTLIEILNNIVWITKKKLHGFGRHGVLNNMDSHLGCKI